MDLDPDSVLPLIELERPASTRQTKMPMTTAGTPGELPLAADDETSLPALVKRLLGGDV
jgi:hypothetical protein